jgi:hypothetical protein
MITHIWEDERLFVIQKELQQLIDDKSVKSIISLNLTHTHNEKYSAILIYK